MGVPNLRRYLTPFAERVRLTGNRRNFVIDGPAMVYHILHLCKLKTNLASPFELPSYQLIVDTTIAWLDELQASCIFFDGFLPESKRPERIHRLVRSTNQLARYASKYSTGVPIGDARQSSNRTVDPFPATAITYSGLTPPPPAFAVPAVIEALKSSAKYGSLTHVVAGEADVFCARHVHAHGGTVITSDSDLLVHDLGPDGAVIFFDDLAMTSQLISPFKVLMGLEYRSRDICKRLNVEMDRLTDVAFEVSNGAISLESAVKQARSGKTKGDIPQEYDTFVKEYSSPEMGQAGGTDHAQLDPRVSELVLQQLAGETAVDLGRELDMYLPVLFEGPQRSSAWAPSAPIRVLSYALLQLMGEPFSVLEQRKRQEAARGGTVLELPGTTEIDEQASELLDLILKIRKDVSNPDLTWVILAVWLNINDSITRGKNAAIVLGLLYNQSRGKLDTSTWDYVHFAAEVQAACYSLRMFQQIFDFVSSRSTHEGLSAARDLRTCISTEPLPIASFPSINNLAELLGKMRDEGGMSCVAAVLDLPDDMAEQIREILETPTAGLPSTKTSAQGPVLQQRLGRKRPAMTMKKKAGVSKPVPKARPASSNPFAILGGDDPFAVLEEKAT